MQRRKNITAANAINLILSILARSVLVVFGLINLLGILWYWRNTNSVDFARGVVFSISALYIGFPQKAYSDKKSSQYRYYTICIFGILASVWLCIQYVSENYRSFFDIFEQLFIIASFIFIGAKARRK